MTPNFLSPSYTHTHKHTLEPELSLGCFFLRWLELVKKKLTFHFPFDVVFATYGTTEKTHHLLHRP
uniref:Uncharacterized protein n=1 Tax=Anopheles coluzzii TaxID=1518534 RepID=A0A6E8WBN0_ANOCL